MNAEQIARGLGGPYHREGNSWRTECPCHTGTADNSLALWDDPAKGRVRVHCFTGCDFRDVIDELRARGLWEGQEHDWRAHKHQQPRHTRQHASARPPRPPLPGPATPPSGMWRSLV